MKKQIKDFFRHGAITPIILAVAGLLSFLAVAGIVANPFFSTSTVAMRIESPMSVLTVGSVFTISVVVESTIAVNAFEGKIEFDSSIFSIQKIDYNTSIANLWVQEPWYSKGEGTIYFAGGTTRKGGFLGDGTLMTITLSTVKSGVGNIGLRNTRILQSDGLGTDTSLAQSINSVFTINADPSTTREILQTQSAQPRLLTILKEKPSTDLNGDGKQSFSDLSIFMFHLGTQNIRSDFNGDGRVNTADLSILINIK